jgi:predicted Zn-dependent peptidase
MKMKPIIRCLGLAALASLSWSVAAPLAAQQTDQATKARVQPPAPLPLKPVSFPAFTERKLANGAQVIIVEDHTAPIVSLSLRIRSGSAADPADKMGMADFTAALLDKGTKSRSAREIAESIDFVGGTLSAGASADWTNINATVLTEFLDTALGLMSDIVLNPTFPESELETYRQRVLSSLQVELGQPQAIASRRFMAEIYGAHPYGASPTPETVRAIERADLAAFHQAHFRPDNALIVVAGDVGADDVVARLNRAFNGWKRGAAPRVRATEPPARHAREITLVHKPGSVQAVIRIGHLLPSATHKDWITLEVANQILGGGTTGWFFRILRSEKGYTYGAYASAAQRPGPGYFQASAEVRNEVADSAMSEFFRLLDQIRDQPVPEDDLRMARDYMVGSFPLTIETPQQIAGQVARTRLLGLPADHLVKYRDRVAATNAKLLQRVVREQFRPDQAAVVVVGDATSILDKIKPFGPVRVVDVNGAPIKEEDLQVRASGLELDASKIQPQSLGYRVSVQGNAIAEIKTEITREVLGGRPAVRVISTGTGMLSSESDLAFDAENFAAIYSHGRQQAGPQAISIEVAIEGDRVTGKLDVGAGQSTEIDAEVVAGTLLPGMDEYALRLIDLEGMKEFELPVFNPQTATVLPVQYRVTGESKVTVPAGEFEVYEVEATGGPIPLKLYLRKDGTHLMVKQEYVGQPVVVELTALQ